MATASDSKDAVRYVRRASELCEALSGPVPGLSTECMDYTRNHPSNAYDSAIMHTFAEGLCRAGLKEKCAAVYFNLLQVGPFIPTLFILQLWRGYLLEYIAMV